MRGLSSSFTIFSSIFLIFCLTTVASNITNQVSTPYDDVIWSGGGVVLYKNYTYSASFNRSDVEEKKSSASESAQLVGGTYALKCANKRVHLQPVNHTIFNGTHSMLGDYNAVTVNFVVQDNVCNGTRFAASFKHYAISSSSTGAVIFTQTFPDGILNTTYPVAKTNSSNDANNPPILPPGHASAFPLFTNPMENNIKSNSSGSNSRRNDMGLGWLTWNGMFMGAKWGTSSGFGGGQEGGPIVVFDVTARHGAGVVLSTFDEHFTCQLHLSGYGFAGGISSTVTTIPRGYSTSFLFAMGSGGVTSIIMNWGKILQLAHNTSRKLATTDVITTKLGYWTDNEAYYDWYHWFPNVTREGKPQDVLISLNNEMIAKNLNIHYWQLDAYWYKLEIKPAYCVVDWHAVADQFPKGLAWLSQQLGAPLMLYTDTWCEDNIYRKNKGGKYNFMDGDPVHISWFDGNTSNVVPEESLQFYRDIMHLGKSQGMGAFEVDFLNYNFKLYSRFRSEPGAFATWIKGMDDAAVESNVSIQYCMTLPQQLLNSVALRAVTSTRIDGDGGRPYYNAGGTLLLAAALGVRPFKDNAWTSGSFPKGLADIVGSVLFMGPVGLADKLNNTNATIASMACTLDGVLLHPSRPATPIDATYLPGAFSGSVMATHSIPQQQSSNIPRIWYIIASSDVNDKSLKLLPDDLWPLPSSPMVWWRWSNEKCQAGGVVSDCVTEFSKARQGFTPSAASKSIELYHVSPVLNGGWILLGEKSKIVPVSAARIANVQENHVSVLAHSRSAVAGITVTVVGSSGERIEMLFARVENDDMIRGIGTILSRVVVLPASGQATLHVP